MAQTQIRGFDDYLAWLKYRDTDEQMRGGGGYAVINSVNSSASPEDVIYVVNGSTKYLEINLVEIHNPQATAASSWDLFLNPVVTNNGTSLTIVNRKTGGPASTATAYRNPTVTSTGSIIWATSTNGTKVSILNPSIYLSPNHGVILRRTGSGGGNVQRIVMKWVER